MAMQGAHSCKEASIRLMALDLVAMCHFTSTSGFSLCWATLRIARMDLSCPYRERRSVCLDRCVRDGVCQAELSIDMRFHSEDRDGRRIYNRAVA